MNYAYKDLVREAKGGSPKAQLELLDHLKPLLYSTIKRYAWGLDKEEMLQEASLCLLEGIQEYDESKGIPFLAYIKVRLKFYIYNQSRKQRVTYSLNTSANASLDGDESQDFLDLVVDDRLDLVDSILHSEQKASVHAALNQLEPRLRQVILLHYFNRTSLKEIAKQQGVSYKTILRWKDKALAILEDFLQDSHYPM
jgi:RNA polymerase sporulation-specific sigma factor